MPDWKQRIVGDAFHLPSRSANYYRDLFLFWPFLLFTIAALVILLKRTDDYRTGLEYASLSVLSIVLARERIILIGAALGFCAVQSLLAFVLRHDFVGLLAGVLFAVAFLLLAYKLRNYKPNYEWPRGLSLTSLLIGLSSLGLSILLFRWIGP